MKTEMKNPWNSVADENASKPQWMNHPVVRILSKVFMLAVFGIFILMWQVLENVFKSEEEPIEEKPLYNEGAYLDPDYDDDGVKRW
ncbi:hypothetical protein CYQ88_08385 [Hydrogenovibrio sp. SC-1]|uniref:hypothetical protein n=1 Tax=Hydrogenovibrio sp. SC-1 TaxID=2065820 RepID=UPI000C79703B|nr:hypothetical protein [Hydrogenovibrio sp. SC-1]PLA73972.1 hypothetical protein CYQ88_08385 [Hydrogenovibrio sp. SC-1]